MGAVKFKETDPIKYNAQALLRSITVLQTKEEETFVKIRQYIEQHQANADFDIKEYMVDESKKILAHSAISLIPFHIHLLVPLFSCDIKAICFYHSLDSIPDQFKNNLLTWLKLQGMKFSLDKNEFKLMRPQINWLLLKHFKWIDQEDFWLSIPEYRP